MVRPRPPAPREQKRPSGYQSCPRKIPKGGQTRPPHVAPQAVLGRPAATSAPPLHLSSFVTTAASPCRSRGALLPKVVGVFLRPWRHHQLVGATGVPLAPDLSACGSRGSGVAPRQLVLRQHGLEEAGCVDGGRSGFISLIWPNLWPAALSIP
jgi:hypothetical protein